MHRRDFSQRPAAPSGGTLRHRGSMSSRAVAPPSTVIDSSPANAQAPARASGRVSAPVSAPTSTPMDARHSSRGRGQGHGHSTAISVRGQGAAAAPQVVDNRRPLTPIQEDVAAPNPPPSAWHKWAMMGGLIVLGLLVIGLGVFMMTLHRKVSSMETERSATINEDDVRHIVQQSNQSILQKVGQVMENFSKDMGQRLDARLASSAHAMTPPVVVDVAPAPAPAPVSAPASAPAPAPAGVDVGTIQGEADTHDKIAWTSTPLPSSGDGSAIGSPKEEAAPPQHVQLDM